jgi:hypothetical protein
VTVQSLGLLQLLGKDPSRLGQEAVLLEEEISTVLHVHEPGRREGKVLLGSHGDWTGPALQPATPSPPQLISWAPSAASS